MFPTITDLTKNPANDVSQDWMRASEDAQKLSVFYRTLANDQFNAYEKTLDRIMAAHGSAPRYRDQQGRFTSVKKVASNDRVDRYQQTLDRIIQLHSDHDNAKGIGDAENDNRIIHDYNPEVPQSMYREMQKYVMKEDKPVGSFESVFTADDQREELDVLKSISNDTTNITDILHQIMSVFKDKEDVESLRAREKGLESGHVFNQESIDALLAGYSGAERNGRNTQGKSKAGLLAKVAGALEAPEALLGMAAAGLGLTAGSEVLGGGTPSHAGGGNTGSAQSKDNTNAYTGRVPERHAIEPSAKEEPTIAGPARVTGSKRKQELQVMAYDSFKKLGYTDEAAKEMVGQIGRENAFNEDTSGRLGDVFGYHTDPGNHERNLGIISWQKQRRIDLEHYLESQGLMKNGKIERSQRSMDAMARFLDNEMKTGTGGLGKKGKEAYQAARDPNKSREELSHAFGENVIKWDPHRDPNGRKREEQFYESVTKLIDSRIQNSSSNVNEELYKRFKNDRAILQKNIAEKSMPDKSNVTVNNNHHTVVNNSQQKSTPLEKKRPIPAKSEWWDEWKTYFGL